MRPQPHTEKYRQPGKLGVGQVVFGRKEHMRWWFRAKGSALKTHIQEMLHGLSRLYLEIQMCIHIHICRHEITIGEQLVKKEGMGLKESV